jgi:ferrous iron transport protein B
MQCTSTLATVKRETNSWRWPLFQFAYMSAVAYTMAWITFHLSTWLLQR